MNKEQLFLYKLKNDKEWYIRNFLKIKNKAAEVVPFIPNVAQRIVLDQIKKDEKLKKPKRYIVLKARQMGLSTLFEGIIFHDSTTNENKNSLIIAHEEAASSNLFSMSKLFYECLPEEIRPMRKYSNGKILSFENPESDEGKKHSNPGLRSKISIATAGTGEVGRSATIHNLHVSELAFFPDPKTTMLGLLQSVPDSPNTFVVLESTANGVGDFFYSMWQAAVKGENEFTSIFLPWFMDPLYTTKFPTEAFKEQFMEEVDSIHTDRDGKEHRTYEYNLMTKHKLTYEQLHWRRITVRNKCQGDETLFMQEYPSTPEEAFISSGRPKFNLEALQKYTAIAREPLYTGYLYYDDAGKVLLREDKSGYVSVWEEPIKGRRYSIGADVAEGLVHGDYSAAAVGDNESLDLVATWHGHIDPDLYGHELVKLAKFYEEAYLGVEGNNHGLTTLTAIKNLNYYNVYFSKIHDRYTNHVTKKLGWYTTIKTKPLMIDILAEYVRDMHLGIPSSEVLSEMFTYIVNDKGGTSAQEGEGCFDDLVIAMGIMLQLILEDMGVNYKPESPSSFEVKKRTPDILDPLFEDEDAGKSEAAN